MHQDKEMAILEDPGLKEDWIHREHFLLCSRIVVTDGHCSSSQVFCHSS